MHSLRKNVYNSKVIHSLLLFIHAQLIHKWQTSYAQHVYNSKKTKKTHKKSYTQFPKVIHSFMHKQKTLVKTLFCVAKTTIKKSCNIKYFLLDSTFLRPQKRPFSSLAITHNDTFCHRKDNFLSMHFWQQSKINAKNNIALKRLKCRSKQLFCKNVYWYQFWFLTP